MQNTSSAWQMSWCIWKQELADWIVFQTPPALPTLSTAAQRISVLIRLMEKTA